MFEVIFKSKEGCSDKYPYPSSYKKETVVIFRVERVDIGLGGINIHFNDGTWMAVDFVASTADTVSIKCPTKFRLINHGVFDSVEIRNLLVSI